MAVAWMLLLTLSTQASATGIDLTDDPIVLTPQYGANARFGTWILGVGDTDGDGYDDILVCADHLYETEYDDIEATLFFGGPEGPSDADHRVLGGGDMGTSCLPAGDVDGDGRMDVVVAWHEYSSSGRGDTELHYGDGTSRSLGQTDLATFWAPMHPVGDLDGDGLQDGVLEEGVSDSTTGESHAAVHFGRNNWRHDSSDNPRWTTRQTDPSHLNRVGRAGDLDNDGYDDLAVMVQHSPSRSADELLILMGSNGAMSIGATLSAGTRATGERMDGGEDFDGDGIEDMVFGWRPDSYDSVFPSDGGGAIVVTGAGNSDVIERTWSILPSTSSLSYDTPLGSHVGFAGDVDRDGHADVFIGGPTTRSRTRETGIVFLAYGGPSGASATTSVTSGNGDRWETPVPLGASAGHEFGRSMADVGDVNADGVNDIALGWSNYYWTPSDPPYYHTDEAGDVRVWLGACIDADGDAVCAYDDCDEADPTIPSETDDWYDGVDSDCDGWSDFDADRDGSDSADHGGDDCDDTNPEIRPDADEIWYDGIDMDCDGWNDFDADRDGFDSAAHGGDDCDDTDPGVYPDAPDAWYDGVDANCDGASDYDADADGYDSADHGGDDCDDDKPGVHPGAPDAPQDGVDADCDGVDPTMDEAAEWSSDDDDDDDDGGGCSAAPRAPALSLAGLVVLGLLRRRTDRRRPTGPGSRLTPGDDHRPV